MRNKIESQNPVVNMALNLADRRRHGVEDVEVKLICDTYDRSFNIKANAIREDCHLHDLFLREWLGHVLKGVDINNVIEEIDRKGSYNGSFIMQHAFTIKVTKRPKNHG